MRNNLLKLFIFSLCLVITSFCFAKQNSAKHHVKKHNQIKHTVLAPTKIRYPIEHWVTDRGVEVYFLPTTNLPIVDIQIAFAAGSSRDGKLSGIATLTNSLLNDGTDQHSADQIAEGFESLGARYSNDTSRDIATVAIRSLTDKKLLDKAVNLFAEVITQPEFSENDFNRERNNQFAAIQQQMQSPSNIAVNQFYKTLYGKHPYANPVLGTPQTLLQLSARHAREFYEQYYTAQNATLSIVGKIDRVAAEQIAYQLTHDLSIGRKAPPFVDNPPLSNSIFKTVNYPAKQTNILIGQFGIARSSPDYFPLMVGNYILGGGELVSRLFGEVREKRGLSYSAYSQFVPMTNTGPFMISLGTRTNKAQQALDVTNGVLRRFIKTGPTAAELAAAKKHINGNFALQLDSNQALANTLLLIGFYDLPADYLNTYQAKVNAVTLLQIRKAFQQHLDPTKLVTIQVGEDAKETSSTMPSHAQAS